MTKKMWKIQLEAFAVLCFRIENFAKINWENQKDYTVKVAAQKKWEKGGRNLIWWFKFCNCVVEYIKSIIFYEDYFAYCRCP